jgi:hypothetical protein
MYPYKIMNYVGYEIELRTMMGITIEELTDDEINSLPIMPSAERDVVRLVPDYENILATDLETDLFLAVLSYAAFYALPGVKLKILQTESDNKTVATRFKDAISISPTSYKAKAARYIANVLGIDNFTGSIFDLHKPNTDVITGSSYVA